MARTRFTIELRVAWWVRPYLWSMARLPLLTRRLPDIDRVQRTVMRGLKVKVPR